MKVIGMIPARLTSNRLPEKALLELAGLPMIVHTCKRAQLAKSLNKVYLVTDSDKIRDVATKHDIEVIMTGSHHQSGSDRIAEAAGHVDADIVVNVQGDEPLVNPRHIDRIVKALEEDNSVKVALGVTEYSRKKSPSDIKAVLDLHDNILYCSRADLPSDARQEVPILLKMCFVVAFRKPFLIEYSSWPPTPLEKLEYNEYLRILEHGEQIRAVRIEDAKISVDTPQDLEIVRQLIMEDNVREEYM